MQMITVKMTQSHQTETFVRGKRCGFRKSEREGRKIASLFSSISIFPQI